MSSTNNNGDILIYVFTNSRDMFSTFIRSGEHGYADNIRLKFSYAVFYFLPDWMIRAVQNLLEIFIALEKFSLV